MTAIMFPLNIFPLSPQPGDKRGGVTPTKFSPSLAPRQKMHAGASLRKKVTVKSAMNAPTPGGKIHRSLGFGDDAKSTSSSISADQTSNSSTSSSTSSSSSAFQRSFLNSQINKEQENKRTEKKTPLLHQLRFQPLLQYLIEVNSIGIWKKKEREEKKCPRCQPPVVLQG
jgi:hypothetical protein